MDAPERPQAAAITALGMVSALGDGARPSCAALRAGITRLAELPGITLDLAGGARVPAVGSAIHAVAGDARGLDRFAALASAALDDLARSAGLDALRDAPLFLALPPADRPGLDPRLHRELGAAIEARGLLPDLARRTRVFSGGHAALAPALRAALGELAQGREGVIVGGVDSLIEPDLLRALHARGRLAVPPRRVGFFPGEGAALLLLEAPARALTRGAGVLALLEAPASAREAITVDTPEPCDGAGLSAAIEETLAALADGGSAIGLCYSDLNGEPFRSEELSQALVRSLRHVPRSLGLRHLADSLGDTGAASMALSLAAAATALHLGHARTSSVLCTASSDGGLRGSVHLRAHPGKAG
jgi:3-oxoacyl-[acyl-carrier-protein] synthase-1